MLTGSVFLLIFLQQILDWPLFYRDSLDFSGVVDRLDPGR